MWQNLVLDLVDEKTEMSDRALCRSVALDMLRYKQAPLYNKGMCLRL